MSFVLILSVRIILSPTPVLQIIYIWQLMSFLNKLKGDKYKQRSSDSLRCRFLSSQP